MKTNYGLKILPPDSRDFPLGKSVDLPPLSDLPNEFILETTGVKDQKNSDFCSVFAAATISELQEGVKLSPEYIFAKAKELLNSYEGWGLTLRDVGNALVKKGSIKQEDSPYTVETKDREFLANWQNWPADLDKKALFHSKHSYFWLSSVDEIKQTIWKFKNVGVLVGVLWNWPSYSKIIDTIPTTGYGHALAIKGWKRILGKEYLVIQNSWGESAGDKGDHYFSGEVIEHFIKQYGALAFIDISPEDAKRRLDNGAKLDDNWLVDLLKSLWSLLKSLWQRSQK